MARILVVEDNVVQAYALRQLLTRLGHTITGIAAAAGEAEALFGADPPDLLLLDISLRDGDDGINLGGYLVRRHPVPLIFVTALADQSTFERAREAGPFAFLGKPYDEVMLARTIELAIRNFRAVTGPPVVAVGGPATGWQPAEALFVRDQSRHVRVFLHEINRAEADGTYVHLYSPTRKYTMRTSLREIEDRLPPGVFMRVHRGWLVRLDAIEAVQYSEGVIQINGASIPLSRPYRDELRQRLG